MRLDHEDQGQDDQRQRDDVGVEDRRRDLQALDRAEHRDRRGDHAVAVEQRRADDAQQDDEMAPFLAAARPEGQGGQGQHAALAAVVGAHHEGDVFDRDDQRRRPEDQRQHAQHRPLGDAGRPRMGEAFPDGVERAGADVAIHDADDAEQLGGERLAVARVGCEGRHRAFLVGWRAVDNPAVAGMPIAPSLHSGPRVRGSPRRGKPRLRSAPAVALRCSGRRRPRAPRR